MDSNPEPAVPQVSDEVAAMSDAEFAAAVRATGVHVGPPRAPAPARGWRKRRQRRRALQFIADALGETHNS